MSALLERARAAATVAGKHCDEVDRDGRFPHETRAALKAERLYSALIPHNLGGDGASLAEVAEVCCLLGQNCASSAMMYAMHNIKLASVVSHGGGSDWHRAFMQRISDEQLLIASATTEGGIGGDLRNSICAIEDDGDNFNLVKDATVISYGSLADAILVTARRAPDAASNDQVMACVTRDQYTLEKTAGWDTLGMRGTCSEGYKFAARAPRAQILPKPFAEIAAQSMLASSHLLWSSLWYGIAHNAVSRAQAFVRAEAKKKPGVQQPGALRVAEAANMLQFLKSNVVEGLQRFAKAQRDPDELSSIGFAVAMNNVKTGASRMAVEIINHAMMVCGIMGYKNNTPYSLGRHIRDAMSAPVMINNDRIYSNTSNLLLIHKLEPTLLG